MMLDSQKNHYEKAEKLLQNIEIRIQQVEILLGKRKKYYFWPEIKEIDEDGYYSREEIWEVYSNQVVCDGIWLLLRKVRDNLAYNIDWITENWKKINPSKRLEKLLLNLRPVIADLLLWVNFKKPAQNIKIIQNKNDIEPVTLIRWWWNLWYYDNAVIYWTYDLMKELGIKSVALGGAVADCAAICGNYNNGEIISLTHAGWQWIFNRVIEQLVSAYYLKIWRKALKKVKFDISPTAWVNYEWESKFFDIKFLKDYVKKLKEIKKSYSNWDISCIDNYYTEIKKLPLYEAFLSLFEDYDIDPIAEKIFIKDNVNPEKGIFILRKLIERIFVENWVDPEQLNFHPAFTTDLNNRWPSYRIHSMWKNWQIKPDWTKKSSNWVVYDARMGVFNIVRKR